MYSHVNLTDIDDEFKVTYQSILSKLMDHVPQDSTVQSTLKKTDDLYFGKIDIISAGQKFFAKTLSKTPQKAMAICTSSAPTARRWMSMGWSGVSALRAP